MRPRTVLNIGVVLLVSMMGTLHLQAEENKSTRKCSQQPKVCAQQIREILSHRKYLGIRVIAGRSNIEIQQVVPGSPADEYGLKAGDHVIAVNGQDCSHISVEKFKRLLGSLHETQKLVFTINRSGLISLISVRPAYLTKQQIDQAIEAHLREAHGETQAEAEAEAAHH
ncbi:MAG: PDZ domain-containing protein [Thermoanaerobaculia bacterium]